MAAKLPVSRQTWCVRLKPTGQRSLLEGGCFGMSDRLGHLSLSLSLKARDMKPFVPKSQQQLLVWFLRKQPRILPLPQKQSSWPVALIAGSELFPGHRIDSGLGTWLTSGRRVVMEIAALECRGKPLQTWRLQKKTGLCIEIYRHQQNLGKVKTRRTPELHVYGQKKNESHQTTRIETREEGMSVRTAANHPGNPRRPPLLNRQLSPKPAGSEPT